MHELPWLLNAPLDFNTRCANICESKSVADDVRALAGYALSLNQSNRLVRTIQKLPETQRQSLLQDLTPVKLGVVSNATINLMIPSFVASALRYGIYVEITTTDYGQVAQEAFDPGSKLNQSGPDIILLAMDYRAYPFAADVLATAAEGQSSTSALEYINQTRQAYASNSGAVCIVQTLAPPPYSITGNLDSRLSGMLRKEIADFNMGLIKSLENSSDVLLDIHCIASSVGLNQWFDARQWHLSKVPMANCFIPLYTEHVSRLVAAIRGKSKKALVLDLDNTLWGGVIGDDGMEGIQLGHGNALGEAYLAIQRYAKELNKKGIVLAVCSKNDYATARQVFREHPDMILKENDIAVFVANWDDKANNIRQIANTLNLGLDALVFLDDNPAEREIIRMLVPEVAVPEFPDEVAFIPRILSAAGYFEMIDLTQDDIARAAQYVENAGRQTLLASSGGLDEFLQSLDMKIKFLPFDEFGKKRITQLINKTNQFNLTTQRYTEKEVEQFEKSPSVFTLQVRLTDRFGDNGMISVIICREIDECWEIDSWLMSCRVIKRRVEETVCDHLVASAKEKGIKLIRGFYRSTVKNTLVSDHYKLLGFSQTDATPEQDTWELITDQYAPKRPPIEVWDE